jgi:hypothetical protein
MIHLLLISKDRACQLRNLLYSITVNAPKLFDITINYTYSSDQFREGYEKLQKEDLGQIRWKKEENLREDYLNSCRATTCALTCLGTDDCVFYRPFPYSSENVEELVDNETISYSFRLGRVNTLTQDYQTGRMQPPLHDWFNPKIGDKYSGNFVKYDWTSGDPNLNWFYWFSEDFHCYRTEDNLKMTEMVDFKMFRHLEGNLNGGLRQKWFHKPLMCIGHKSYVVNVPTNNCQGEAIPCSKYNNIGLEELNTKYLDGQVIRLEEMDFSNVQGCHSDIKLVLS